MDFNDLMNNCWSSAINTLKTIEERNKEEELMAHLEKIFEPYFDNVPTITEVNDYLWDNVPTMTEVNDYLRFEDEFIFQCLGISETEEEEEEEDDLEESEIDFSQYVDFDSFCAGRDCNTCPFFHYVMENKGFDCEEYFNQKYKK